MLDFSFNALVATWFAVADDAATAPCDGAVFGVEVSKAMSSSTWSNPRWSTAAGEAPWDGNRDFIECWVPPPLEARIGLQHSCFIYGRVPDKPEVRQRASIPLVFRRWQTERIFKSRPGHGKYPNRMVAVLRIPYDAKDELRAFLCRVADLDHRTVFGDLAGFAEHRRPRSTSHGSTRGAA